LNKEKSVQVLRHGSNVCYNTSLLAKALFTAQTLRCSKIETFGNRGSKTSNKA
jgi:hypothetical protein